MGFTTLLDILGSVIIGGVMMTIAYRLSDTITERTYNHGGELSIQQNLATSAQIIEYDFRTIFRSWQSTDFRKWLCANDFGDTGSIYNRSTILSRCL